MYTTRSTLELESFYLVVPPGLELAAQKEWEEKMAWAQKILATYSIHFTFGSCHTVPGGVQVQSSMLGLFLANTLLKIPSRVLWILGQFRATDFPKLYNKLQTIPWKNVLWDGQVSVQSSSVQSRLFDSRKMEKATLDALEKYFLSNPHRIKDIELLKKELTAKQLNTKKEVFIHLKDDQCTVSINTSGLRLGLRGIKTLVGEAPLRENLAAGMLYQLQPLLNKSHILIDPCCGSGTFLFEGLLWNQSNTSRSFTFSTFKIWRDFLKKHNLTEEKLNDFLHKNLLPPLFTQAYGLDNNVDILKKAEENVEAAKKSYPFLQQALLFLEEDALNTNPIKNKEIFSLQNPIVVCNPPYGLRLSTEEIDEKGLFSFYRQLLLATRKKYTPRAIAMLIPRFCSAQDLAKQSGLSLYSNLPLSHGGLKLQWIIFTDGELRTT